MASSSISFVGDDEKDPDDAELWAVIDSVVASHTPAVSSNSYQTPIRHRYKVESSDGDVLQESPINRPQKIARTMSSPGYGSRENRMAMVRHVQRTPTTPMSPAGGGGGGHGGENRMAVVPRTPKTPSSYSYSSSSPSPNPGRFSVQEVSPVCEGSELGFARNDVREETRHSLFGRFPSVALFKQYQNAAMAILEPTDYIKIYGIPYIKKSGWRKIACYFDISYEIKDKSIEFDQNRNVLRAEFVFRAHMQGGRYSDGWGSCSRGEKKFTRPNHDIPSTAETRAKNKACQDLLGIGEYRENAANG